MSLTVSAACERMRAHISLELDDPVSELERRMLAAHLARCDDCRTFAAEVDAFTRALREAPLESPERPIVVRRPRRSTLERLQMGVAAAVAVTAIGIASQLAAPQSGSTGFGSASQFQTRTELERELDLIELVQKRTASFQGASVL
jgi:predicted anti-sigma-YlaC factor YlaD